MMLPVWPEYVPILYCNVTFPQELAFPDDSRMHSSAVFPQQESIRQELCFTCALSDIQ